MPTRRPVAPGSAPATNVALFGRVTDKYAFDLVVGDETYELVGAFAKRPALKRAPFTMICDFVGLDPASRNPWNGCWCTPRALASTAVRLLGSDPTWPPIPCDGAKPGCRVDRQRRVASPGHAEGTLGPASTRCTCRC